MQPFPILILSLRCFCSFPNSSMRVVLVYNNVFSAGNLPKKSVNILEWALVALFSI